MKTTEMSCLLLLFLIGCSEITPEKQPLVQESTATEKTVVVPDTNEERSEITRKNKKAVPSAVKTERSKSETERIFENAKQKTLDEIDVALKNIGLEIGKYDEELSRSRIRGEIRKATAVYNKILSLQDQYDEVEQRKKTSAVAKASYLSLDKADRIAVRKHKLVDESLLPFEPGISGKRLDQNTLPKLKIRFDGVYQSKSQATYYSGTFKNGRLENTPKRSVYDYLVFSKSGICYFILGDSPGSNKLAIQEPKDPGSETFTRHEGFDSEVPGLVLGLVNDGTKRAFNQGELRQTKDGVCFGFEREFIGNTESNVFEVSATETKLFVKQKISVDGELETVDRVFEFVRVSAKKNRVKQHGG